MTTPTESEIVSQARIAHRAWSIGSAKTKLDYQHEMRVLGGMPEEYDRALSRESTQRITNTKDREHA